ncbi:hypothetical protein EJF36_13590 [Bacillus sp. HMF5848]|uniref:competence type IV pilus minor pilin ComGG n=1 Tax=Bacillus sp. HMF5848 TaxID=2495421 RepID=UPI000F7753B0|nr:competence type IV pilus minor pilin ComGG [Bacillus sp. HMF5848]RSK27825.1 hypothetical protein EJF36_13590 [Bacillus sp. HMF5848]
MNNENGYVAPVVLFITFILFVALSTNITLYVNEKKFLQETNNLFALEQLEQCLTVDAKTYISQKILKSSFQYPNGSGSYEATQLTDKLYKVNVTVSLSDGYERKNELYIHVDK